MLDISKKFISKNFNLRPDGIIISSIVIHFTEMDNFLEAIDRLTNPYYKTSSHYIIRKDGIIYELVPPHLRAWHAGISSWRGRENVNDFSIGIELDNNGKEEFSKPLMNSLILLCKQLSKIFAIENEFIVAHSDIAPSRKIDPGYFFDWGILKENNIGIHHNIHSNDSCLLVVPFEVNKVQEMLKTIGYKIEITGILDEQTMYVIRAFNLRFYQSNKNNVINNGFLKRLKNLALAMSYI